MIEMCPQLSWGSPEAAAFRVSRGDTTPHPGDAASHLGDEHSTLIFQLLNAQGLNTQKHSLLHDSVQSASEMTVIVSTKESDASPVSVLLTTSLQSCSFITFILNSSLYPLKT